MISLIILIVIFGYSIIAYNNLTRKRNNTENAFGSIDAMLKKRFDLIPNLVATVQQYAKHEENTFTRITELRSRNYDSLTTEEKSEFDFVVSRAVMPLNDLMKLIRKNIRKKQQNAMPNGLICLKGGELQNEVAPFKKISIVYNLKEYFKEEYFDTKKVVYVPVHK